MVQPVNPFVIQLAVVRALAESSTLKEAFPAVLRAVCETTSWEWGALWRVDRESNTLRCDLTWSAPGVRIREFEQLTLQTRLPPGVGLPGRVWQNRAPAWIQDVAQDDNFPRRAIATKAGLHGALSFPVLRGGEVLAIVEFFSREIRAPDEPLLALMAVMGEQIGQFVHRRQVEDALFLSQASSRSMVDTSLDCIVSMDSHGRVTEWNPAAEKTFGFSRHDVLGKEMASLIIPPALRPQHRDGLRRYLETGEGPVLGRRIEITAIRADGSEFPVELAITRVPSVTPPIFTGCIRDITDAKNADKERKRLLEAESAARQEAESANSMKDAFLATLGHELRTPLHAIVGWTQVLRQGLNLPNERDAALETIERNAKSMARILEDMLDVSRIITGRMRLDVRPIDLPRVIEDAVGAVLPAAEAKGIQVERIFTPLASPVMGDSLRLQQVVWNLLSNAIKFTPKGGQVLVVLKRVLSHVELSVSDTGEGIAPEFLPHLFRRFAQADPSTSRLHQGLGLGLAIVRHLVELHGGTIRAHSDGPGHGSIFTLTLPLAPIRTSPTDPNPLEPRAEEMAGGEPSPVLSLEGVRVLIVDDEAEGRQIVKTILSSRHAQILVAESGQQALALLQREKPDVLLSDIGMPQMDGCELIQRVRALPPQEGGRIPAAALTAFARPEERERALLAGFDLHIPKPVDSMELIAVVAQLARRTGPSSGRAHENPI